MWTYNSEPIYEYAIYLQVIGSKDRECIGSKESLISAMDAADAYIKKNGLEEDYEIVIDGPDYKSWANRGLGWQKAS